MCVGPFLASCCCSGLLVYHPSSVGKDFEIVKIIRICHYLGGKLFVVLCRNPTSLAFVLVMYALRFDCCSAGDQAVGREAHDIDKIKLAGNFAIEKVHLLYGDLLIRTLTGHENLVVTTQTLRFRGLHKRTS